MRLVEIIQLNFEVEVVDGMRIGGSGGDFEIGATVDANLSALRDPITGEPYIPGSSLKGKLRSLAEKVNGSFVYRDGRREESQEGNPCKCGRNECRVCPIFGAHMNPSAESAPTRIRVRDAHLTPKSSETYKDSGQLMEHKTENLVNRKTGTARDPRTGERVPPGARFAAHIILQIYDDDKTRKNLYLETIKNALGLLEQADSLGASGSRGFGTVKLDKPRIGTKPVSQFVLDFIGT
jgi:CRISPR-associated protein Csm3